LIFTDFKKIYVKFMCFGYLGSRFAQLGHYNSRIWRYFMVFCGYGLKSRGKYALCVFQTILSEFGAYSKKSPHRLI